MNLRRSLIAGIAATTIAVSGTSVAAAAETEPIVVDSEVTTDITTEEEEETETSSDPEEIREWIGVFTSVIGAMTITYNLIDRYVAD